MLIELPVTEQRYLAVRQCAARARSLDSHQGAGRGTIYRVGEDPSAQGYDRRHKGHVLRALNVADLDELLEVQAEGATVGLGHIFPQDEYPFPIQDVRSRWEQELMDPAMTCFAALDLAGNLAGFAAISGNQFLHFGTALRAWGTGLAGQAHDEVLAHIAAQHFDHAWLRVFEANERARHFYERRGWVMTGERSQSTFPPKPVLLHYRIELVSDSQ